MEVTESILNSIKKLLGLDYEYDVFDADIMMHISSVFRILNQLGVGKKGFSVTSENDKWVDFLGANYQDLDIVKTYVYLKVRILFDPPQNSFLVSNMQEQIREYEWRLNVQVENEATQNVD